MGIPDHLTCFLRNLYSVQETTAKIRDETTAKIRNETTDWFQIGKGVHQGCMCNEHTMCNAGLDEGQAGIKIARKNINNLKYAVDTTLVAENKELKSLLMKVKEESEKS